MKKILLFAFAVFISQLITKTELYGKDRNKEVRVITYNIHHGNPPAEKGKIDLDAIATVISNSKADFALLQEVESGTTRSFGQNQAKEIVFLKHNPCLLYLEETLMQSRIVLN